MSDWQRDEDRNLWRAAQYSHIYGQEYAQSYLAWTRALPGIAIVIIVCILFPAILLIPLGILLLWGSIVAFQAIRTSREAKAKREVQEAAIARHQSAVDRLLHDFQVALRSGNDAAVGEVCKLIAQEEAFGLALPYLHVALGDIDPHLRLCAIRGLRWGAELTENHVPRGSVQNTAGGMPSALLSGVLEDARETTHLRVVAALTLGNGGYTILFGHLIRFLSDSEPDVRAACCHAIGKLTTLLRSDAHLHSTGAKAVSEEERRSGLTAVLNMLRDSSVRVKQEAAQTLGEFRNPQALRPLQELVADRSQPEEVRRAASAAVAAIKNGASF